MGSRQKAWLSYILRIHAYWGSSELGGNSAMAASIATLMDDPNFNLQPVLA
jgi:hypothetical protein